MKGGNTKKLTTFIENLPPPFLLAREVGGGACLLPRGVVLPLLAVAVAVVCRRSVSPSRVAVDGLGAAVCRRSMGCVPPVCRLLAGCVPSVWPSWAPLCPVPGPPGCRVRSLCARSALGSRERGPCSPVLSAARRSLP